MAKNNLLVRQGQCINVGNCTKADSKIIIDVDPGDDFVCPECENTLIEKKSKPGPSPVLIGIIVLAIAAIGIGIFFHLKQGEEQQTLTQDEPEEVVLVDPEPIDEVETTIYDPLAGVESETLRDILSITDPVELENYIKESKDNHKLMWGNITSDINPSWYLVFFTDSEVVAVYDKGSNSRKNLLTGKIESIGTHKNTKKIWFTLHDNNK